MWIKIDVPQDLKRWKPAEVDAWIDVTENNTARVSSDVGEQLMNTREYVTET